MRWFVRSDSDAVVENDRFEKIGAAVAPKSVDLVTVRGIKRDKALFSALHRVLAPDGRAFFFSSERSNPQIPNDFTNVAVVRLGAGNAILNIIKPMFHVEQSGNNIVG